MVISEDPLNTSGKNPYLKCKYFPLIGQRIGIPNGARWSIEMQSMARCDKRSIRDRKPNLRPFLFLERAHTANDTRIAKNIE